MSCEVELNDVVLSEGSTRSMPKTLERYENSNNGAHEPNVSAQQSQELSCQQEYLKLKVQYEALLRRQRNLLGEELGPLSSHELESLERQLDASLKQIRSIRTQHMVDQLTDLQRKEHMLNEANKSLRQQLMEGYQVNGLQLYPQAAGELAFGRPPGHQTSHDVLLRPLDSEPTLNIGYHTDQMSAVSVGPSSSNFMPGWLP